MQKKLKIQENTKEIYPIPPFYDFNLLLEPILFIKYNAAIKYW